MQLDIQEMDVGFVQQVSLDFYAKIEIRTGDGRKLTLWEQNRKDPSNQDDPGAILIFTSKDPISKTEIKHVADTLKARLRDGWHHETD